MSLIAETWGLLVKPRETMCFHMEVSKVELHIHMPFCSEPSQSVSHHCLGNTTTVPPYRTSVELPRTDRSGGGGGGDSALRQLVSRLDGAERRETGRKGKLGGKRGASPEVPGGKKATSNKGSTTTVVTRASLVARSYMKLLVTRSKTLMLMRNPNQGGSPHSMTTISVWDVVLAHPVL